MSSDSRRVGPFGKLEVPSPNDSTAEDSSAQESIGWPLLPEDGMVEELAAETSLTEVVEPESETPPEPVKTPTSTTPYSPFRSSSVSDSTNKPKSDSAFNLAPLFIPRQPHTLKEVGVKDYEVCRLMMKFLLNQGVATGREIADQVKLSYSLISELLKTLKDEQLIVYRRLTSVSDYEYQLTEKGLDQSRRFYQVSSYHGATPVPLDDYIKGMEAQSVAQRKPTEMDLKRAFRELVIGEEMLSQIGQAIHSGSGMFLYGSPGNGKTSLAARMTSIFGDTIWIPRALNIHGEIVRLFDPNNHEEVDDGSLYPEDLDTRWVHIVRPTVVVGGELNMDNLEITRLDNTGVCEAPLQLKSNCGTLVIDDFGRQRMSTTDLLNRWIVPLESGFDFLNLPSGRKIRVPFDQLIVFSTNLEPRELVDEAFLRRIPYKIEVQSPTEGEFRALFQETARAMQFQLDSDVIDYLIETHYKQDDREMRFCHVRDLLRQVRNFCTFHQHDFQVTKAGIDQAVKNYFSIM